MHGVYTKLLSSIITIIIINNHNRNHNNNNDFFTSTAQASQRAVACIRNHCRVQAPCSEICCWWIIPPPHTIHTHPTK
jgi:hypothetical protein